MNFSIFYVNNGFFYGIFCQKQIVNGIFYDQECGRNFHFASIVLLLFAYFF